MDLRLRDDKDLDELLDYGFKYYDSVGQYQFFERRKDACIYINKWNRKVGYSQDTLEDCRCLMKLYDLIKDGFIIMEDNL